MRKHTANQPAPAEATPRSPSPSARSGLHPRVSPDPDALEEFEPPRHSVSRELATPSAYELRALKDELVATLAALARLREELDLKEERIYELEAALRAVQAKPS